MALPCPFSGFHLTHEKLVTFSGASEGSPGPGVIAARFGGFFLSPRGARLAAGLRLAALPEPCGLACRWPVVDATILCFMQCGMAVPLVFPSPWVARRLNKAPGPRQPVLHGSNSVLASAPLRTRSVCSCRLSFATSRPFPGVLHLSGFCGASTGKFLPGLVEVLALAW